jgi:hypothetical protein
MKTEDLIHQLGGDLRPVRRLMPPARRAAVWLLYGAMYVAAMMTLAWVRRGALGVEANAPYVLQQATLASTGVLAALAAFASVIPGSTSRARVALVLSLGVMMVALLWGTLRDVQQFGTVGVGRETDWPCVVSIALGGLALCAIAGVMLRRGAVLEPRATALFAGIAAVSLANIEACVGRIHTFTATVMIWHGATAGVLLLGLIALGPWVLGRPRRSLHNPVAEQNQDERPDEFAKKR